MYLIIYFYVNIMLFWRHLWCCFYVNICGIVLVKLKLLQVLCNRFVKKYSSFKTRWKKEKKEPIVAPLKVHIL